MPVITLSRELGSRGDEIAIEVARRLHLRIAGRDLINRAARQAGAPEVALAEIDELGLLGVKPSLAAQQLCQNTVSEIIQDLAKSEDLLLVGRGGQVVLAQFPGALHVRVIAPLARRSAMIEERCHVTPEVAAARIEASDRARAGYLLRHYGVHWEDPALYDLVLNMARLEVETAVGIVCFVATGSHA
jgi:cytidylate kinase